MRVRGVIRWAVTSVVALITLIVLVAAAVVIALSTDWGHDVVRRKVEAALDGALDDMAVLSAELRRSRRRPLLLRSATNLNRVEDLLLEAIVRSHPNRENALDRLLADVSEDDATAIAAERARAEYDMSIDNDFDGMG